RATPHSLPSLRLHEQTRAVANVGTPWSLDAISNLNYNKWNYSMDKTKAEKILSNIQNTTIEGILIKNYINHGKSAAVFLGERDGDNFAVKIFDNELYEKFGLEIQRGRVDLELKLKNHTIENLVKIISGGDCEIQNDTYLYLIMNYIEGLNLKDYISKNTITPEFLVKVGKTLLKVTEDLLKNEPSLAHRDIKPENVMLSNEGEIILMDLGVLKIIGSPSYTDLGQKQFLGTLRYAAPEFLTRNEVDTIDGWRSVNLYQIGAIFHDLIMGEEIYGQVEPYSNLVIAIKEDVPKIISARFPQPVIQLARNLLIKDWKKRLEINEVSKIHGLLDESLKDTNQSIDYLKEIIETTDEIRVSLDEIKEIQRSNKEKEELRDLISNAIFAKLDHSSKRYSNSEIMKSSRKSKIFSSQAQRRDNSLVKFVIYEFVGKIEYGFSETVLIIFRVTNNENRYSKIEMLGVVQDTNPQSKLDNPENLLIEIFTNNVRSRQNTVIRFANLEMDLPLIFDGVFEQDDQEFSRLIEGYFGKIFKKAVSIMKPNIEEELKFRKAVSEGGSGRVYARSRTLKGYIFIRDF
ncbi:protein kinase domain-containing protein, partial [Leptospira licerasiae]|uniref:protein kinase domain-containing protein n=1 Tax=Leptospira licerasiae TaxID=447106 RepID=UPI003018E296